LLSPLFEEYFEEEYRSKYRNVTRWFFSVTSQKNYKLVSKVQIKKSQPKSLSSFDFESWKRFYLVKLIINPEQQQQQGIKNSILLEES
jgi:hypothetical protein